MLASIILVVLQCAFIYIITSSCPVFATAPALSKQAPPPPGPSRMMSLSSLLGVGSKEKDASTAAPTTPSRPTDRVGA